MSSWVNYSETTEFPIQNLPYGVFHLKTEDVKNARCASAIGDYVIDLSVLQKKGYFESVLPSSSCFSNVYYIYIFTHFHIILLLLIVFSK